MTKANPSTDRIHPDCEDRCQILEHKGYHTCSQTGRCEQFEAEAQLKLDATSSLFSKEHAAELDAIEERDK